MVSKEAVDAVKGIVEELEVQLEEERLTHKRSLCNLIHALIDSDTWEYYQESWDAPGPEKKFKMDMLERVLKDAEERGLDLVAVGDVIYLLAKHFID